MAADEQCGSCPCQLTPGGYFLGLFLVICQFVSFLPQHIKLGLRKSHVGISFGFVVTASFAILVWIVSDIALSPATYKCCAAVSGWYCFGNLMPIFKLLIIAFSENLILILYLVYFDREWLAKNGLNPDAEWNRTRRTVIILFVIEGLDFVAYGILAGTAGVDSRQMYIFGQINVALSSLGIVLQWTPQVYQTYKLRDTGSLSLISVCFQLIGAFLSGYFFSLRKPWYIFLPFVFMGFLLLLLFVLGTYFYIQNGHANKWQDTLRYYVRILLRQPHPPAAPEGGQGPEEDIESALSGMQSSAPPVEMSVVVHDDLDATATHEASKAARRQARRERRAASKAEKKKEKEKSGDVGISGEQSEEQQKKKKKRSKRRQDVEGDEAPTDATEATKKTKKRKTPNNDDGEKKKKKKKKSKPSEESTEAL